MKILGIETSCDETAAAVVENGSTLLSNVVASSEAIHRKYGGIVPEIAARSQIESITPVIKQALDDAKTGWNDIGAIAVTNGPGLAGSLLVGLLAARTLSLVKKKPLFDVNHVQAHIYANFIGANKPKFPLLALIVSGGHSQLVLAKSHFDYRLLGRTQDDAMGEAFDKVAKILGLPYPGGPSIDRAAKKGNPLAYPLPKAKLGNPYDFSFSGLKTAVLRTAQHVCGKSYDFPSSNLPGLLTPLQKADIAASFQKTIVETATEKLAKACGEFSPASVIVAGGVAANAELRKKASEAIKTPVEYPDIKLCTDNAAMVASLGFYKAQAKIQPANPYALDINPSLSM